MFLPAFSNGPGPHSTELPILRCDMMSHCVQDGVTHMGSSMKVQALELWGMGSVCLSHSQGS